MTDINPELIEKALREFIKPRMTTNMSLDGTRAKLAAALSAVADDLRAEALEDAADELHRLDDGRTGGHYSAGRHIIARLRNRAAKLRGES